MLGPIQVRDAHGIRVDIGSRTQRAVLARLLLAGGRVVPADRIIDDLWAGEAPARARGALQSYVSHLRRALKTAATH